MSVSISDRTSSAFNEGTEIFLGRKTMGTYVEIHPHQNDTDKCLKYLYLTHGRKRRTKSRNIKTLDSTI